MYMILHNVKNLYKQLLASTELVCKTTVIIS